MYENGISHPEGKLAGRLDLLHTIGVTQAATVKKGIYEVIIFLNWQVPWYYRPFDDSRLVMVFAELLVGVQALSLHRTWSMWSASILTGSLASKTKMLLGEQH